MPNNPNDWPLEVLVHSNAGFEAFARASGYDEDTINSLRFQSINVPSDIGFGGPAIGARL